MQQLQVSGIATQGRLPLMLSSLGTFSTAASIHKYGGIAPVVERSGKKSWTYWRFICPKFLCQTFVEWVGETILLSFWAKAFYERQRAKGSSHNAAIRALAFKGIRVLWRCWTDRQPYDETRYLLTLQKRHSPVVALAATTS